LLDSEVVLLEIRIIKLILLSKGFAHWWIFFKRNYCRIFILKRSNLFTFLLATSLKSFSSTQRDDDTLFSFAD